MAAEEASKLAWNQVRNHQKVMWMKDSSITICYRKFRTSSGVIYRFFVWMKSTIKNSLPVLICKITWHWKFSCSTLIMKEKKDYIEMHFWSISSCCLRYYIYVIMEKTTFCCLPSIQWDNYESWNHKIKKNPRLFEVNVFKMFGNVSSYLNYFHGVQKICNWKY